jgi:hypothetical protein
MVRATVTPRQISARPFNSGFVIAEAGFGFLSNSTALLVSAGHNLSDVPGLLLVAWVRRRSPSGRQHEMAYTFYPTSDSIIRLRVMTAGRLRSICPTGCLVNRMSRLLSKNISLSFQLKSVLCPRRSAPVRGTYASSRTLGAGCGGRDSARDEARLSRTAKPCGPDAPTLAFKLVMMRAASHGQWWQ